MDSAERDLTLLALLEPEDRAKLEEVVDEIVSFEIPAADGPHLRAAAASFERRGLTLPDDQKIVAWQIAAALRARVPGSAMTVN